MKDSASVPVRRTRRKAKKGPQDPEVYPTLAALSKAYPRCSLYHGFGTLVGVGVDEVSVRWFAWMERRKGFVHKLTTVGTNWDGIELDGFEEVIRA